MLNLYLKYNEEIKGILSSASQAAIVETLREGLEKDNDEPWTASAILALGSSGLLALSYFLDVFIKYYGYDQQSPEVASPPQPVTQKTLQVQYDPDQPDVFMQNLAAALQNVGAQQQQELAKKDDEILTLKHKIEQLTAENRQFKSENDDLKFSAAKNLTINQAESSKYNRKK
jgi:hypothetical protein